MFADRKEKAQGTRERKAKIHFLYALKRRRGGRGRGERIEDRVQILIIVLKL